MILTKIISTAKADILVIGGLPEVLRVVKITGIEDLGLRYIEYPDSTGCTKVPINISGDWQPVGFLKDLNEDDAEKLVEKITFDKWKHYGNVPDYFELLFDTAKESLLSLIESEVKLKNPLADSISAPDIDEWQAEQSEVFTNPFILIKK